MLSSALYCIPGEIFLPKCSPGVMAHSVAPDGSHYSCYRCTPYYNNGECVIPQNSISLKGIRYLDARCEQCAAGCICNACPASVASIRGNTEQKIARCRFSKVMFFASAYFQLELLANHPNHIFLRNKSDYQKHQIAMGARMIFDKLNPETSF